MTMQTQPLEITDFSGGITDGFINGETNRAQTLDNFLISSNKKAYSRPGSIIRDLVHFQIPDGQQRIGRLFIHRDFLLEQSARDVFYLPTGGPYQTLVGPTGNKVLSVGTVSNFASTAFWNLFTIISNDAFSKPQKIFKDNSLNLKVITAGLPHFASTPIVTAGAVGVNNYTYGFHYFYSYMVENVTFELDGPTVEVELENSDDPSISPNSITGIPVLSNGVTDNYDTTNIKVKIFRTEANQTTLLFIAQISNGTTTYSDNNSDTSIANNEPIYTTGGVVDFDPPPPAKFVHVANDFCVYAGVQEGGEYFPNRYRQSIKNQIDSAPESFFDDLEDEITGVSSIQGIPILLCKNSVYRVDGFFDELGRGGLVHLKISDTVGCVSNNSIIQTVEGLIFAGTGGFYFCDGYQVTKINKQLPQTYAKYTVTTDQAKRIYGSYDIKQKKVWWAVQTDQGSLDNDSCIILDTHWGISEESVFTTASGGVSFAPSAIIFFNDLLYRADTRGYIFIHDNNQFLTTENLDDPKVDVFTVPSTWVRQTVIYTYESCAFNMGTTFLRKWAPWITLTLENRTNISAQIFSVNDEGRSTKPLVEIRFRGNLTWGDPDLTWGDPTLIWNYDGLIDAKRRFPAGGLRFSYKQIKITNAYTFITNSDVRGLATVDNIAKTLTLNNTSTSWPADSVDYFISFETDNYAQQYLVIDRTDLVLTYMDVNDTSPNSVGIKWELQGYAKNEQIGLLAYAIHYVLLSKSQQGFHSSDSGANQ